MNKITLCSKDLNDKQKWADDEFGNMHCCEAWHTGKESNDYTYWVCTVPNGVQHRNHKFTYYWGAQFNPKNEKVLAEWPNKNYTKKVEPKIAPKVAGRGIKVFHTGGEIKPGESVMVELDYEMVKTIRLMAGHVNPNPGSRSHLTSAIYFALNKIVPQHGIDDDVSNLEGSFKFKKNEGFNSIPD